MWWLLLIPAVLLLVGVLLFRPSPLHIKRTRNIRKPQAEVFAKVRDFRSWQEWSPWLLAEPEATVNYTGDTTAVGGKYSWDGQIVGAGEMEHESITEPDRLGMALRFTRPFKSTAKVAFEFNHHNDGTEVTWSMDSKMPKVLVPMFRTMIGMDYDRGLHMLADLLETGTIDSHLEFPGIVNRPELYWIGIEGSCPMDGIGPAMSKTFEQLKERLAAGGITPGPGLSIYSRWDFKTSTCSYIAAFEVKTGCCCDGTTTGLIPSHRAYSVIHLGPYDHLGNAWSAAHSHTRARKLKCPKGGPFPYEIYANNPEVVPPGEIRTEVYLPVR